MTAKERDWLTVGISAFAAMISLASALFSGITAWTNYRASLERVVIAESEHEPPVAGSFLSLQQEFFISNLSARTVTLTDSQCASRYGDISDNTLIRIGNCDFEPRLDFPIPISPGESITLHLNVQLNPPDDVRQIMAAFHRARPGSDVFDFARYMAGRYGRDFYGNAWLDNSTSIGPSDPILPDVELPFDGGFSFGFTGTPGAPLDEIYTQYFGFDLTSAAGNQFQSELYFVHLGTPGGF